MWAKRQEQFQAAGGVGGASRFLAAIRRTHTLNNVRVEPLSINYHTNFLSLLYLYLSFSALSLSLFFFSLSPSLSVP